MMKRRMAVSLLVLLAASAYAGVYDPVLCPIYKGEFLVITGQLWLQITHVNGKPVDVRREKVANALDERSHEVLTKRGRVSVEAHPDQTSGDLFIHWGTLQDDK